MVSYKDCERQSRQVWKQFGERLWIPHAWINSGLESRDCEELRNSGIGKTLVSVALGASLEDNIETLKANREKYDLLVCDKGFKKLLERGIKADFVHLADANILPKWMDGAWESTEGVRLISTPYANPTWTRRWRGPRYFYVNKDAIRSEGTFLKIMGPKTRVIPASTNVSNAMVVFMVGVDEKERTHFAGYDQILMVGYDYSWRLGGNYYAFENPEPKRYYMAHRTLLDMNDELVRSSENLIFSARWMHTYCSMHNLTVWNCSGRGLLDIALRAPLKDRLEKTCPEPEKRRSRMRDLFEGMRDTYHAFEKAKSEFNRQREALHAWS